MVSWQSIETLAGQNGRPTSDRRQYVLPIFLAAVTLVGHLLANGHYGFFRDELYFIICGRHPQFGYVDQPPVVPLLAAASQIFGLSLEALRAVSASFAASAVYVACRLVQELRGGATAMILAGIGVALAPVLASFGVLVYPDMVQIWAWPLMSLYVLRLIHGADARLWLGIGAILGLAIESKYIVIFFAVAMLIGLGLTPERRIMATPWFFVAALVAGAMALPNFLWQAHYGFPMIELLRNSQHGKNVVLDPLSYMLQQALLTNPILAVVWGIGLLWAFFRPHLRWLGIGAVSLMAMVIAFHGKDYYGCAIYPGLFASGGVAVEAWTRRIPTFRLFVTLFAAFAGLLLIPLAMPILSEQQFLSYTRALKISAGKPSENHRQSVLPQTYADMHGWPQLAAAVAHVYESLPPAERTRAVIKASNYGEASALNIFGGQYHLPPTVSGHNQYFLWGPLGYSGDVLIDVNGDCGSGRRVFRRVIKAATFKAPYVMPYENDIPIMVCRGIVRPLTQIWPAFKDYN